MVADYVEEIVATLEELGFEVCGLKRDIGLIFITLNKKPQKKLTERWLSIFAKKQILGCIPVYC